MRCSTIRWGLVLAPLLLGTHRANGQAMLADDIIILSKGQREQEKARTTTTHLGGIPGVGGGRLRANPGSSESALGERSGALVPRRDVLSAASGGGQLPQPLGETRITPPRRLPGQTAS